MTLPENHTAVELQNVTKVFQNSASHTTAVNSISLNLNWGELVLVLGPSGSGKTTLLNLMAGFLRPTQGIVRISGKNINEMTPSFLQRFRVNTIGFVFQSFRLIESLNIWDNVCLALRFAGITGKTAREQAQTLLEQFGVGHLAKKYPRQVSHGEKQRVALARALANNPPLIIADEPTANLESNRAHEIVHLLKSLVKSNLHSVIIATHDERIIASADRIFRLNDGILRIY